MSPLPLQYWHHSGQVSLGSMTSSVKLVRPRPLHSEQSTRPDPQHSVHGSGGYSLLTNALGFTMSGPLPAPCPPRVASPPFDPFAFLSPLASGSDSAATLASAAAENPTPTPTRKGGAGIAEWRRHVLKLRCMRLASIAKNRARKKISSAIVARRPLRRAGRTTTETLARTVTDASCSVDDLGAFAKAGSRVRERARRNVGPGNDA